MRNNVWENLLECKFSSFNTQPSMYFCVVCFKNIYLRFYFLQILLFGVIDRDLNYLFPEIRQQKVHCLTSLIKVKTFHGIFVFYETCLSKQHCF